MNHSYSSAQVLLDIIKELNRYDSFITFTLSSVRSPEESLLFVTDNLAISDFVSRFPKRLFRHKKLNIRKLVENLLKDSSVSIYHLLGHYNYHNNSNSLKTRIANSSISSLDSAEEFDIDIDNDNDTNLVPYLLNTSITVNISEADFYPIPKLSETIVEKKDKMFDNDNDNDTHQIDLSLVATFEYASNSHNTQHYFPQTVEQFLDKSFLRDVEILLEIKINTKNQSFIIRDQFSLNLLLQTYENLTYTTQLLSSSHSSTDLNYSLNSCSEFFLSLERLSKKTNSFPLLECDFLINLFKIDPDTYFKTKSLLSLL